MKKLIYNLKNKKFNRLKAIEYTGKKGRWLFLCDCGKRKIINGTPVRKGLVKSCGCFHLERCEKGLNRVKHGHTVGKKRSPEHSVWSHIFARTQNKNSAHYKDYGGRGIKICKRWFKFENFLEDMGKKPDKQSTLDRINNDGDYKPSNCRWASRKQQARNRRSTRWVKLGGQTKSMAEWCEIKNLNYAKICARVNKLQWPIEKAFI